MNDPIVQEVRKAREQLASLSNFDVHAIFSDVYERQKSLGTRLVSRKNLAKAGRMKNGIAPKDGKQ